MARQKSQGVTWRCNLTIPEEVAGRLRRYAAGVDRAPTTAAAELMVAGLDAATQGEGDDLADLRRRNEELQRQNDELRGTLDELGKKPASREAGEERQPRWEWPVEELLADRGWWDRWLPRLYELLGRASADLQYLAKDEEAVTADDRGYIDLMGRLFPPAGPVTWRSPDYPRSVAEPARDGLRGSAAVYAWEPVLRHVALALCALEDTGLPGGSPHLRMETVALITNSWVRVLDNLAGQQSHHQLPGPVH